MASSAHPGRARNRRTPPPTMPSTEQIERIITIANADPRLHVTRDVVTILSETGIRSGELRGLRVSDIDVANSRLFISGGKAGKERYIPLTPRALNALQSLHTQHPSSGFVLGEEAHRVIQRVSLTFRKIAMQQGLGTVNLHCLRRSFAVRLARNGIDIWILSRLMGYSSPLSTLRYFPILGNYQELTDGRLLNLLGSSNK